MAGNRLYSLIDGIDYAQHASLALPNGSVIADTKNRSLPEQIELCNQPTNPPTANASAVLFHSSADVFRALSPKAGARAIDPASRVASSRRKRSLQVVEAADRQTRVDCYPIEVVLLSAHQVDRGCYTSIRSSISTGSPLAIDLFAAMPVRML